MKLKIFHSALNSLSADSLIRSLKDRDRSQKHIIITPDKSSLTYERKLFSILNEDSFFDVTTTTLSRFANNVVGKMDNILSKQGGILIVKRILLENKNDLISFNKSTDLIGFAGSLFDTICMFKSCNILPSDIEENKNLTLNNKLHDIKLVYEKYEEYLQEKYTDSFNRLNLCADKISKEDFQNTHFYFVGFEDFTKQGYQIITKLIKCASSVNVATTYARKGAKNNSNIYLNSIYYNLIDIAKLLGVTAETCEVEVSLDEEKTYLSNQIYAYKVDAIKQKNNYIDLYKYDNLNDEVKNISQQIKYSIINNNLRYKNFAILVSDMSKYKKSLLKELDNVGINYFLDESEKLNDTELSRFVSNLISILYKPTKYNIINFLKSNLMCVNAVDIDKYYRYIDKYEPYGELLINCEGFAVCDILQVFKKYFVDKDLEIEELLNNLRQLLDDINFEEKVDQLMQKYFAKNDLKNYREVKQSYNKIIKIFDEITVIKDYKCTYAELNKFYDLFAENSSIVVPPVVADAVYISDLSCENIVDVDYVYYLGFNEGLAPKFSSDSGIISDEEIDKMPESKKLNPTINVINKRLKFKLFELLFIANKKAIISFPTKSDEGELFGNNIVSNLIAIYGQDVVKNGSAVIDIINNNINDFDDENFIYNNFSKQNAIDNFVKLLKYWDNYSDNKNYLKTLSILNNIIGDKKYIDNMLFKNNIDPINVDLFMKNNKVGISEIERFNTCPYMHFVDYGLKLKPSEKSDLSVMDIGNIIHEFVSTAIFRLGEENISKSILDSILKNEDYKYLTENKKNNFVIKALYDEVERIFNVLKYQQRVSGFTTTKVELPFNMKFMKINGKDICLTGIVDRIDKFNNGIRVIDYKTGNISFKNFEDVYYGNKIQVVIYLSSLCAGKLQPLGALYLPISNAFSDSKSEDLYMMQGVVENSFETLLAYDKNLTKESYSSNIINVSTTSKGAISSNNYYKNMCLTNEDMQFLCGFVEDLVKNSIVKINKNEISPYPIDEDSCRYCEYRGLCNFSQKYGNSYRKELEIKTLEDMKESGNE